MRKIYITVIIATISLITYNCTTDSIDGLVDVPDNPTQQSVTYNQDIATIINGTCLPCHSNPPQPGVPISLSTSDEVRISTNNNLIDRISRQTGEDGAMPLGGSRLPQATIDLIIQWRDQGFLEGE